MTLISHTHKFIFVHVEKTGGKSIALALENLAVPWWKAEHTKCPKGVNRPHPSFATLKKHCDFDTSKYFKFAFIRNPYERLWSAYHFFRQDEKFRVTDKDAHRQSHMVFQKWLYVQGVRPMSDFLFDENGNMAVDYVGVCNETMGVQFKEICKKIGLPEIELPHINKSVHGGYFYTDKMKQFVQEKYAKDIKLWDTYNT